MAPGYSTLRLPCVVEINLAPHRRHGHRTWPCFTRALHATPYLHSGVVGWFGCRYKGMGHSAAQDEIDDVLAWFKVALKPAHDVATAKL